MDNEQSVGQSSFYSMYNNNYTSRYGRNISDVNRCILLANMCMLILVLILSITTCTLVSIQYMNISEHIFSGNYTSEIDYNELLKIINTTNLKLKIQLYMISYNE